MSQHPLSREGEARDRLRLWASMARAILTPRRMSIVSLAAALHSVTELSYQEIKRLVGARGGGS
jgi:hypothetical protein